MFIIFLKRVFLKINFIDLYKLYLIFNNDNQTRKVMFLVFLRDLSKIIKKKQFNE